MEDDPNQKSQPISKSALLSILENHLDKEIAKNVIRACLKQAYSFNFITLDAF